MLVVTNKADAFSTLLFSAYAMFPSSYLLQMTISALRQLMVMFHMKLHKLDFTV